MIVKSADLTNTGSLELPRASLDFIRGKNKMSVTDNIREAKRYRASLLSELNQDESDKTLFELEEEIETVLRGNFQ